MGATASSTSRRGSGTLRPPSCGVCRAWSHGAQEGGACRGGGSPQGPVSRRILPEEAPSASADAESGRCSGRSAGSYPLSFSAELMEAVERGDPQALERLLEAHVGTPAKVCLGPPSIPCVCIMSVSVCACVCLVSLCCPAGRGVGLRRRQRLSPRVALSLNRQSQASPQAAAHSRLQRRLCVAFSRVFQDAQICQRGSPIGGQGAPLSPHCLYCFSRGRRS